MEIKRANNAAMKYACLKFHYAKAIPTNPIGYNVYNNSGTWCGVILFGFGANCNIGKPYGLLQGEIIELTRVALNGQQECTSQAVAMALKQVKKDCPMVRLCISYADIDQRHIGTIYQATNWVYAGETASNSRKFIVNGKKMHAKSIYNYMIKEKGKLVHCPCNLEAVRKHIDPMAQLIKSDGKRKYLYAFDKKMKRQILPLSNPYPKADSNWVKIDRSVFSKKAVKVEG